MSIHDIFIAGHTKHLFIIYAHEHERGSKSDARTLSYNMVNFMPVCMRLHGYKYMVQNWIPSIFS